jgi:hypothetical protein
VPFIRRFILLALLPAAAFALYGCGSGSGADSSPVSHARVGERDFRISAPATLPAGRVDLSVDNMGPDDHELIVVRTSKALPRRPDGLIVNEDAVERQTVGVIEPGLGPRHLQLDLHPGRYVMFCNMEGHYLGGMHRRFRVD